MERPTIDLRGDTGTLDQWVEQARCELDHIAECERERRDSIVRAHYALGRVAELAAQAK